MPTLDIGGQRVQVGDDFLKLPPEQQQSTVDEIAGSLPKAAKPDGAMEVANVASGGMIRGVPILGPAIDAGARKGAAGIRSLMHGTKYADELKAVSDYADQNIAAHPNVETGANLVGGAGSLVGAAATIPGAAYGLGMTGTLPGMIGRGALSGAAIGGADATVRGESPGSGAAVGGILGAAAPVAGRMVGKAYDKVAGALKPAPPVVPQNVLDVNGVKVPVRESVLTRNADTSLTEQAHLNGGGQAQEVARAAEEGTQNAMAKAHGDLAASFDPASAQPRIAPLEAGQAVARDLVAQEDARAAAEVARLSGLASENAGLKAAAEPVGAVKPAPDNPFQAMQAASEGIQNRFTAARAATNAAYEAKGAIPGEYNPRHLLGAGEEIRLRLNSGKDRVMVSDDVTPTAARALKIIDENVSGLQFPNDAARGARPITPADMEQTRKTLVSLRRQANTAARTSGNWEDPRAIGRVLDEFSDLTKRVARKPGGFSGDAEALIAAEDKARGLHSQERAAFSRRGPGDAVGTMMENIVGKYPGQETRPNDLVRTLFGNPDNPGGGKQAVAQLEHLRNVLGPDSPEWAGIKKAAISHFTEPVPGGDPIAPTKQAARIRKFLADPDHSGAIFDSGQRAALSAHADNLMAAHDALPQNSVEKIISRWSGRTDGIPASGKEVIDGLLNAERGTSAKLAKELKTKLSPESWSTLRGGLFSKITEAPEGATAFGYQKIGENLAKFLNTELAQEVYTVNQRTMMKALADAYHKLVPIPGTTNPSGSAIMGKKLMTGLRSQVLGMIGFSHGGLGGAGVGIALDRALSWGASRKAAKDATRLFYGEQPKVGGDTAMRAQLERLTATGVRASQPR